MRVRETSSTLQEGNGNKRMGDVEQAYGAWQKGLGT